MRFGHRRRFSSGQCDLHHIVPRPTPVMTWGIRWRCPMYVDFTQAVDTGARRAASAPTLATSDEVLMERIANGDRDAMRALYLRHHVRVHRFVLRLVRN